MTDRRQDILDAALQVFVTKGYSSATIADIRKASGATTGSIYHFFGGKAQIAVAIWSDANSDWERLSVARRAGDSPESLVRATVLGLAEWALADRALFLFYEDMRIRALTDPELAEILRISETGANEAERVYQEWVAAGAVRNMPWPLASALIVGPTYDYLRKSSQVTDHSEALSTLADQAWAVVRI